MATANHLSIPGQPGSVNLFSSVNAVPWATVVSVCLRDISSSACCHIRGCLTGPSLITPPFRKMGTVAPLE